MANQQHLDILKQGVDTWNRGRDQYPDIPDLSGANLQNAHLAQAMLADVDLSGADLTQADLLGANLSLAKLSGAKLTRADMSGAILFRTDLSHADFSSTKLVMTFFGDVDLSEVKGLNTVNHTVPSTIGIDTIYRSKGNIPEAFLKGAGVDDAFITYIRSLVGKAIDYYSCFISYSSKDQDFAERLHADLQAKGVRCWFAPEDLKIGDKLRYRIDESIRLYDKLPLVLSTHSVASQWVEHEVEPALGKELEGKPNVLFPIRLDEAVMQSRTGWASHIRFTRHIGNFTRWKEHDEYQTAFAQLLRDLKAEANKAEP